MTEYVHLEHEDHVKAARPSRLSRKSRRAAVTAWALSTENLRRPADELEPYFDVLEELFARLPRLSARLGFSLAVSAGASRDLAGPDGVSLWTVATPRRVPRLSGRRSNFKRVVPAACVPGAFRRQSATRASVRESMAARWLASSGLRSYRAARVLGET